MAETERLTLNLGLRWDLNSPVFEIQDRVNYGFDTQVINPVSAQINQQQFPGYQVRGGLGIDGQIFVERHALILLGFRDRHFVEGEGMAQAMRADGMARLGETDAIPGKQLRRTVDIDLQIAAEEALAGKNEAIVAMDPHTGEIPAMVSGPTFDPNDVAVHVSRDASNKCLDLPLGTS